MLRALSRLVLKISKNEDGTKSLGTWFSEGRSWLHLLDNLSMGTLGLLLAPCASPLWAESPSLSLSSLGKCSYPHLLQWPLAEITLILHPLWCRAPNWMQYVLRSTMQKGIIPSLQMLAMPLLTQPRRFLAFSAARAGAGSHSAPSTEGPECFCTLQLPRMAVLKLYHCKGLFFTRHQTFAPAPCRTSSDYSWAVLTACLGPSG